MKKIGKKYVEKRLRQRSFRTEVLSDLPPHLLLRFFNRDGVFLTDLVLVSKPVVRAEGDDAVFGRVVDATALQPVHIEVECVLEPHRPDKQALVMEPA